MKNLTKLMKKKNSGYPASWRSRALAGTVLARSPGRFTAVFGMGTGLASPVWPGAKFL